MSELTMKNTKQELYDAYMAQKKQLEARSAMKDDPVVTQENKRKAAVLVSADEVAEMDILSPGVVQQYKDLREAIDMKKATLKDLYDIEAEAASLVALINAHKDKEQELKDKYKKLSDDLEAEYQEKKTLKENDLIELEIKKEEVLEVTANENKALVEELTKARKREKEEYEYNLKRERKIAEDKWNDEQAAKEKALAEREASIAETEAVLAAKEEYVEELERKVSEIPELIETATNEGIKKGKADADKSNAFEVRSINQKNEYEQAALRDRVTRLESDLDASNAKNDVLQEKLDAAYAQMRELAAETVKSAGGVKIIGNENSGK